MASSFESNDIMTSYMMIIVMVLVMNHEKRKQIISFINCHVKISKFLNFCFNQSSMTTLMPWKQVTLNQKKKLFEGQFPNEIYGKEMKFRICPFILNRVISSPGIKLQNQIKVYFLNLRLYMLFSVLNVSQSLLPLVHRNKTFVSMRLGAKETMRHSRYEKVKVKINTSLCSHWVKRTQIQSYFWSVFSCIQS